MLRVSFGAAHVEGVYDEIDRRIEMLIRDGLTPDDIKEERKSMLQGVYSTLMTLSSNWPDVRSCCDREEEKRGYFE